MSNSTYITYCSVKFYFQQIYTDYANYSYFDKRSHLIYFLAGMVLEWSPFKIVSDRHAHHSKQLLLLKIEFS